MEPVIPHFAEWFNKVGYFLHIFYIEVIVDLPAVLFLFQQCALGEYLSVVI